MAPLKHQQSVHSPPSRAKPLTSDKTCYVYQQDQKSHSHAENPPRTDRYTTAPVRTIRQSAYSCMQHCDIGHATSEARAPAPIADSQSARLALVGISQVRKNAFSASITSARSTSDLRN